jgi:hypothetical protein
VGAPPGHPRRGVDRRRGLTRRGSAGFDGAAVDAGLPSGPTGTRRWDTKGTRMDLWQEAFDEMDAIDPKQLNLEQRLRRAEVKALLVIAQEMAAARQRAE